MTTTPRQFLLFPDPKFTHDKLHWATSQEGRFVAPLVPDDDNEGDLLPFAQGDPTDDNEQQYRIIQSGGLFSASWVWRDETGQSDFFGTHDVRFADHPFNLYAGDNFKAVGLATVYSTVFNRLIVFRRDSTTPSSSKLADIEMRLRDADPFGNVLSWDSLTFSPTEWGATYAHNELVALELPDGALRLFVETWLSPRHDFDIYGSTDGGRNWTKLHTDISNQFGLSRTDARKVRGAPSGDWLRICYLDANDSYKVNTIVSSDRGATWQQISDISDAPASNGENWDEYAYDLVGIDDASGSFLLVLKTATAQTKFYYGTADQDWQELTDFGTDFFAAGLNDSYRRLVMVRDNARIYAFVWRENSGTPANRGWSMRSVRTDRFLTESEWSNVNVTTHCFPNANGAHRFPPANIHACFAGDRLFFVSGLVDRDDSYNVEDYVVSWDMMGWKGRSFARARGNFGIAEASTDLFDHEWIAAFGRAAGIADVSSDTPWTQVDNGGYSVNWHPNRTQFLTPGVGDYVYHVYDDGASPSDKWAEQSFFAWSNLIPYSPSITNRRALARFFMADSSGATYDVSVRYQAAAGTTRFVVHDEVAGSTVLDRSGLTFDSQYYEWRLAIEKEGATQRGQLAWKAIAAATWNLSNPFTLASGGTGNQRVHLGNYAASASGITSEWRSMQICGTTSLGQMRWELVYGRNCAPDPVYVRAGRSVRWGGGGGFEGDRFLEDLPYAQGAVNLFTPSPRQKWVSTSAVTQQLIFNAGTSEVFIHDGIALVGCQARRCIIEYNDTNTWMSPAAVETINFATTPNEDTQFDQLLGDMARMSSGDGYNRFVSGELVDHYLQRVSNDKCLKPTKHHGSTLQADGGVTDLVSAGHTTGANYRILSPDAVHVYSQRHVYQWMRWTFDNPTALLIGSNLSNTFSVGAAVVGTTQPVDVPLDWVYDDREDPNIEMLEARGGARWSRKEGPSRRIVEGRLTGDIQKFRLAMRGLVDHLAEYSNHPMVLVLDEEQLALRSSVLYCRYTGSSDLEQQGWYRDANGVLRPVGDTSVTFDEEV